MAIYSIGKIRTLMMAAWSCCFLWAATPVYAESDPLSAALTPAPDAQGLAPRPFDDPELDPGLFYEDSQVNSTGGSRLMDDEILLEDLSHVDGPFDSMFPQLANADNPFYHAVETDRASFTPALSSAATGTVILESGYSYIANRQHIGSEHSVPELVIRYGLTDRLEARFGWNEEVGKGASMISPVQQQEGLAPVTKGRAQTEYVSRFMGGFKYRLIEQADWLPAHTILFEGFIPSYGNTKKKEIAATYVLGWELAPRWKLNASLRYATESQQRDDWNTWSPAIALKAPFAERWTAQVEAFGVIPQGHAGGLPQYFAGPGLQALLTPGFELNLRLGTGLNSVSPQFYLSTGVGLAF